MLLSSIVAVYVLKAFFLLFVNWRQNNFSNSLSKTLEDLLFKYYLDQPYSFHLSRNSAVLLRNFNEISQLGEMIQVFIALIIEISAILGVVGLIVYVEPKGALIVTTFLGILMFVFHRFTKTRVVKWGEERQNIGAIKNQILFPSL